MDFGFRNRAGAYSVLIALFSNNWP